MVKYTEEAEKFIEELREKKLSMMDIDEILLSTESFGNDVLKGSKSADKLFPAEKSYETSSEAKEFIDFIECEREDYKAFAIEFIKGLCDIK